MRWEGREESSNVEDQRGMGFGPVAAMGGGGSIVLLVLAMLFGVDPRVLGPLIDSDPPAEVRQGPRRTDPAEDRLASFTKVVLRDTELVWDQLFLQQRQRYEPPRLVLYDGRVRSACGLGAAAMGPFYCPGDKKVFIDLSFYRDMERKLRSPGEFARAYVIAHEVGHHVQHELGFTRDSERARGRVGKAEQNRTSVQVELQADYLAGVWAHHAEKRFQFLESGDVESALNAAFEIGDDRLQKKSQGYVVPDSFTHGTSQQRMAAFKDGLQSGDLPGARKFTERTVASGGGWW